MINKNAFALLENIFVVIILSASFFSIFAFLSNEYKSILLEKERLCGVLLSQEKMEHLIFKGYSNLASESVTTIPDFNGYSTEVIVSQIDDNDLSTEVTWGSSNYRKIIVRVFHNRLKTIELCTIKANF
jgi:type II secretory pathway pseudopilin PulG